MSIKGVIFDFDGTLFDSMGIWETVGEDYLHSVGRAAKNGLRNVLKPMSLLQSAQYLKEQYSLPLTIDEIMAGINKAVEEFYFHRAMPKEHVLPFLTHLQKLGIRMCIATATDRYQVEAALKRSNMLRFFDEIFTCTDVGHGKDEPHIFDHARAFLNVGKDESAVFEDAYHAAKTAKDAGYFVVGIYDQYEKRSEELKQLANVYVSSFAEAEKMLCI